MFSTHSYAVYPPSPKKRGVVSGAAKEETWTSDYVDDSGEAIVFTTFTQVKGCNKNMAEWLTKVSLDCCYSKAAAAATKFVQAKAYGVFALDEGKSLALVTAASDRLTTSGQQVALAALGVAGTF